MLSTIAYHEFLVSQDTMDSFIIALVTHAERIEKFSFCNMYNPSGIIAGSEFFFSDGSSVQVYTYPTLKNRAIMYSPFGSVWYQLKS